MGILENKTIDIWEYLDDDLTSEEIEELQSYSYENDFYCDKAIERIKEIDLDIQRLKEIAKKRKQEIDENLEKQVTKLEKRKQWDLFNLGSIIDNDPTAKETKTQRKKVYFSGEVIRKKEYNKIIKPNWNEREIKKYVDDKYQKVKVELDWKEYKKTLILNDDKVYDKNGELIDSILVENVPAKTIVK